MVLVPAAVPGRRPPARGRQRLPSLSVWQSLGRRTAARAWKPQFSHRFSQRLPRGPEIAKPRGCQTAWQPLANQSGAGRGRGKGGPDPGRGMKFGTPPAVLLRTGRPARPPRPRYQWLAGGPAIAGALTFRSPKRTNGETTGVRARSAALTNPPPGRPGSTAGTPSSFYFPGPARHLRPTKCRGAASELPC
jgi:hypothetical protein